MCVMIPVFWLPTFDDQEKIFCAPVSTFIWIRMSVFAVLSFGKKGDTMNGSTYTKHRKRCGQMLPSFIIPVMLVMFCGWSSVSARAAIAVE